MAGGLFLPVASFPTATFPAPAPRSGGVADRRALDRAASASQTAREFRFVALGQSIRVVLGEDRLAAWPLYSLPLSGLLVIPILWCWNRAGNGGVQSISWGDEALPAGVEVVHYDGGAGNTVDPWLAAAWAAQGETYTDTMAGWCYSVLRMPPATAAQPGSLEGVAAIVRGAIAYDERTGLTAWNDNASVMIAKYIEDADWGMGELMDHATVPDAADANDELVAGEKRRRIGLTIASDVAVGDMLEALRTLAGCWVLPGEAGARLIPDRPLASLTPIGDGTAYKLREVAETEKESNEITVVRVWYTDRSVTPWRPYYVEAKHPLVDSGGVPYRDQDVRLPGIPAASQAQREANERLNHMLLGDFKVRYGLCDEGVLDLFEPGQGVTLTAAWAALSAKDLRIFSRSGNGEGDFDFVALEYNAAVYSDAVASGPSLPDTNLADPNKPTPPTGLVLSEELFVIQGDKTGSRIKAVWVAPADFPWVDHYRVNVRAAGEVVWPATVKPGDVFRSGALAELVSYQVDVHTVSRSGAVSAPLSDTIVAQGKLLPPTDIAAMSGFEVGGEVFLTIGAVIDIDLKGIEVRYGAPAVAWAAARFVDFKPAASGVGAVVRTNIIPEGTWDFLACGRDSGGRYSTNPKRLTITVTKDDRAFLVDEHLFDGTPTLTLMSAVQILRGGPVHWITDAGDDMNYGHADPDPATGDYADLADQPFSAPRSGGTAIWESAAWDLGVIVSGNWSVAADIGIHSGTVDVVLVLSEDAVGWTDHVGTSHKATARFAKLRIEGDGVWQLSAAPSVRVDAVPRTETGTVTTSASGAVTVTLDGKYSFVKSIKLTLIGAPPGSAYYDNVTIAPDGTVSFDIHRFNSSDTRISADVAWEANAV